MRHHFRDGKLYRVVTGDNEEEEELVALFAALASSKPETAVPTHAFVVSCHQTHHSSLSRPPF